MSQDNIQADTPQQEEQFASLEEAVFGSNDGSANIESAFTDGSESSNEVAAPQTGQPAQETVQNTDVNNDERRYQYWQSQADKLKAENEQLKTQQAPPVAPQVQEKSNEEQFPLPPSKPERPAGFNREEGFSDPSSQSARYLDAVDSWRDEISEYDRLKSQYDNAVLQEKFDNMETQRVENIKRNQAYQAERRQTAEIKQHVMGHYGMDANQASDFIAKMSKPESLNIDNLVRLYQMNEGGTVQQGQPTNSQPSDTFKQVQNAQQVPSPMGVMPSGNANNDGRTVEDKMMDTMVGNFNQKNPWK
tara:strand:+ start:739 stop:1650 length:912 start_codon:yes stop_codon:yes gene_type:complete